MFDTRIEKFRQELAANLHENILPYWLDRMRATGGGFYGRRAGFARLHADEPRGAILNARILWAFSAAYRVFGNPEYLDAATAAKREIVDRFYDREYGGIYWSVDAHGRPLDTKKQFYALGFAIYGLSEYARATGDAEALDYALRLFDDIESHSRDRIKGGYIEAATRSWQPIEDMRLSDKDFNSSKTMNTHLHIIEPYTNLLRVCDDERVREAAKSLLELFLDKITCPSGHLGLFFDDDWNRQDGIISYGHDVEASWLMLETAQVLGDAGLLDRTLEATRRIADASSEGRCHDGSMIYERHASGAYDNDKHWWVQAENVVGQIYQYVFHNRPEQLARAMESWEYIKAEIVDNEGGEWYWSRKADGSVNRADDKAGFWKCPYHNSRMVLEVYERLKEGVS